MKILIVNISDLNGGAARASYRLHNALLGEDIDSEMLVQHKVSDDYTVLTEISKIRKTLNVLRSLIETIPMKIVKQKRKDFFSPSWFGFSNVVDKINKINPDIVHLHWINDGMIKIEDLVKIKAPIVWSLHDMWAFTGGYHYDDESRDYLHEGSLLEKWVFKRKKRTFSKINNMTIIGLSHWLYESAKESFLLKNKKHVSLPNPIDIDKFKLIDKRVAQALFGLPNDKKLILFGAMNAGSDPRKGFSKFSMALKYLNDEKIELVVFGMSEPQESEELGFITHYMGNINDDVALIALYNSVNVVVVPSLQENLSNVVMESLACGVPVVAFDIGGNSDMIEHQQNGYLAKPLDSVDLANGIEWVIHNENYEELSKNARKKVVNYFDSKVVAKKYIELYKGILCEQ